MTPTQPYENVPTSRNRAYDVAIAFGRKTGMPCQPSPNGPGYSAKVPIEFLDEMLVAAGLLAPRPAPPTPRPTAEWKDRV